MTAYGEDSNAPPPKCQGCGAEMKCQGCDDVRPVAGDLSGGWLLLSPLDRWEIVERVDYDGGFGPVRVWTAATGPDYSWRYWRHKKVNAISPPMHFLGTPEIRVVEYDWSGGPMYAIPTLDTVHHPDLTVALVEAHPAGRGKGWVVSHHPDGGDQVTIECDSKAKARTVLRAAARTHAKALGVKVALPGKAER